MPDENENNIAISELDEALDLTDSAQFPYTQNNGGTLTTFKARLTQIAAKIIEGLSFAGINLPTSAGDKTVENSINFLLDSVGGDPNGNISDSYDPAAAYVKGDLCIYENVLYICTAPTTGTFDPSKWTATTIDNVIGDLSSLETTDKSSVVGAVNEIASYTPVYGNTASGAIATFDTSLALPLQDCTIAINAVQESGTPTPSSPKAISGFTGANIHVADDENPHVIDNVTAITWQSEAGTVYGGLLDVTSGVLTVTHGFKTFTGGADENWTLHGVIANCFYINNELDNPYLNNAKLDYAITNMFVQDTYSRITALTNGQFCLGDTSGTQRLACKNTGVATTADWKTWLSSNNLTIAYKLATPQTYQLTPTQISAIVGTNNVFTDTNGDTSVVYACSLKDYIDSQ